MREAEPVKLLVLYTNNCTPHGKGGTEADRTRSGTQRSPRRRRWGGIPGRSPASMGILRTLGGGGKRQFTEEERPPGLKPALISSRVRGPEGPLFHGDPHIRELFRRLLRRIRGKLGHRRKFLRYALEHGHSLLGPL